STGTVVAAVRSQVSRTRTSQVPAAVVTTRSRLLVSGFSRAGRDVLLLSRGACRGVFYQGRTRSRPTVQVGHEGLDRREVVREDLWPIVTQQVVDVRRR